MQKKGREYQDPESHLGVVFKEGPPVEGGDNMAYEEKAHRGDEEIVEVETLKKNINLEISFSPCMACRIAEPPHGQNDGGWQLYLKWKGFSIKVNKKTSHLCLLRNRTYGGTA